ncbi:MAG: HlyC/CorC family transporter [Gemmatimonadetes bacterium]|nr:HlyC/CorC family transporter [Gemmatimonadota bacterium]
MDPDTLVPTLLSLLVLFAMNAFFVAAEFTLIGVRRSRLEQMARDGDTRAARVRTALENPEELVLAAQLGSSAAALFAGYVASRAGLALFSPWTSGTGSIALLGWSFALQPALAIGLAIVITAVLHVIICEQLPKIIGIQRAEWMASRVTIRPLQLFALILRPLIWMLSWVVGLVTRAGGLNPAGFHPLVHTPEEIRLLVAQSHEQGVVEEDEREMIHGIFEFSETVAREVMTPRTDVVAVPVDIQLDELVQLVALEGHSRLPVFEGTIDNIVGVLLAKDLLPAIWSRSVDGTTHAPFDLKPMVREPYFVPDTKPVDDLLAEFRRQSVHLAIVLDEFGGTYGLVTMEDLLEEIVGEINDEHDVAEPDFAATPEGDVLIDGGASISEVNERFNLELPETDFDTIGGYIFGALGRVPDPGDAVEVPGSVPPVRLQVEETEERRVTRVRLTHSVPVPKPEEEIEMRR